MCALNPRDARSREQPCPTRDSSGCHAAVWVRLPRLARLDRASRGRGAGDGDEPPAAPHPATRASVRTRCVHRGSVSSSAGAPGRAFPTGFRSGLPPPRSVRPAWLARRGLWFRRRSRSGCGPCAERQGRCVGRSPHSPVGRLASCCRGSPRCRDVMLLACRFRSQTNGKAPPSLG